MQQSNIIFVENRKTPQRFGEDKAKAMDEIHKDILLTQRVNLVDNINVRGGFYTQLLARKVMTRRQIQNIKAKKTFSEQTEELLEELEQSGSKAFDLFCEALIADHQQDIVDLFLKPKESQENKEEDQNDCMVKEVKPAGSCSVPQAETHVATYACPKVVSDGSQNTQVLPNMAVREEFEQQTYRRSIEPSHLTLGKPNLPMPSNLEHDAYYFYHNSLSRPNLAQTELHTNSPFKTSGLIPDKEGLLLQHRVGRNASISQMNFPVKNIDSQVPILEIGNNCLDRQTSSIDKLTAHPPGVFNPQSSSSLSSKIATESSQSPLKGLNPFSFQTSNSINPSSIQTYAVNRSSVPQKVEISQYNCLLQGDNSLHYNQTNNNYLGYQDKLNILGNQCMTNEPSEANTDMIRQQVSSAIKLKSSVLPSSSNKQTTIERSYIEIPRHIEVRSSLPSSREMMSMPHYIQTVHTDVEQTNGQMDQEYVVTSRNVPRLLKNDSVDTMNKRSISDEEESLAKRPREDPDCIQTDKLSTPTKMNIIDDKELIVKVVGEQQRRPSKPSVVIEGENHQEVYQKGVLQGVMDDPEIDLTDGPIDVKVDHCSRQFYFANFKQSYSMRRIPRGKALILNVNEVTGKPPRRGTDIDRENLHNMLCQLHFDVTVFNDKDGLTAKEMAIKLQDFSQDEGHRSGEAAIICILSHGEEGYIFGSDGKKFELDGVFSLFDNTCCPMLRGKPKIFIVQACRGGALDRGVQYYTDEHDGSDTRLRQCPSMSDMLICYPTQNGYYAWRNRDRGSWYVEALVQVFMKYAKCEDICTMLNRVNLLVSKKVSNCPQIEMDQMSQMSEYKSTLRMPHLFFFPGIGTLV